MQYHQNESHHKELAACTDEQLCAMAAAGDREAEELLVTRYYGMVRACARPLFLAGGDGEDLIQEGMFGLIQAIREYDADKAASFRTYAEICIRNRLFSALRAASRGKHYPLNESISLDTLSLTVLLTPPVLWIPATLIPSFLLQSGTTWKVFLKVPASTCPSSRRRS